MHVQAHELSEIEHAAQRAGVVIKSVEKCRSASRTELREWKFEMVPGPEKVRMQADGTPNFEQACFHGVDVFLRELLDHKGNLAYMRVEGRRNRQWIDLDRYMRMRDAVANKKLSGGQTYQQACMCGWKTCLTETPKICETTHA